MAVLYSTSCFHLSGETLLTNLTRFINPHRLAAVSSMEMAVTSHLSISDEGVWSHDITHLKTILESLQEHAPGLRELRLSLLFGEQNGRRPLKQTNMFLLLDGFFRATRHRMRATRVELEYHVFHACPCRRVDEHPREKKIETPRMMGVAQWRCLDGAPECQWRSLARYPGPPLQLPNEGNDDCQVPSVGYWVVEGDPGPGPYMITCS